eukprot:gnl/Chilomastix_cuspidata/3052.p3 GENE.gnl/Chilomastix_cuspidata/3052~~gnl/Chilomastix_cuspidata/3052.p3  ORF type:complete len:213 (-),score=99.73 gnl/Chilomastix_cuspidata/3052:313-951(-)
MARLTFEEVVDGFTNLQPACAAATAPGLRVPGYLAAAANMAQLVGECGLQLRLIRRDILGNVRKIAAASERHGEEHLAALIELERDAGVAGADRSATTGLLWLQRALDFCAVVVAAALDRSAPFRELVRRGYQEQLARYHGELSQRLAPHVMRFTPGRARFIRTLLAGASGATDEAALGTAAARLERGISAASAEVYAIFRRNGVDTERVSK